MSGPRTVAPYTRVRAKDRKHGFRLARNPLPSVGELIMGAPTLGLPIALMTSQIVDRMLEHRQPLSAQMRWKLGEPVFENVAAMERAFGLLNEAPLSKEQASQERLLLAKRPP